MFATRTDIDEAFIGEYVDRLADARQLPADVAEGIKNTMNGDLGNRTQKTVPTGQPIKLLLHLVP